MDRELYFGYCRLLGEDSRESLVLAKNYARFLSNQRHYGEAKALLRKTIPVARGVLGENNDLTLRMRWSYAWALFVSGGPPARPWAATLDVIREAVTTLTEIERTARRVLGGGHPMTVNIARCLQKALRDLRRAVETLAETERTTRRVLGSAHPVTVGIEAELRDSRAALAGRRALGLEERRALGLEDLLE